jgi:hypothetical protein
MGASYTSPFVVMPDAEMNIANLLANNADVLAVGTSLNPQLPVNISTSMIGYDNSKVWVHVIRSGGIPEMYTADHPILHFAVFAPQKQTAQLLAQTVRAAILASQPCTIISPNGLGMRINQATDHAGLAYVVDQAGLGFYTFALELTTMPIPLNAPQVT